jgi:hypothetical protein
LLFFFFFVLGSPPDRGRLKNLPWRLKFRL